ncbi:glycosyltransferase family 1 protein [Priestia megaterium]
MNIYINGRFLTQNITGVQRYAIEILKQLDKEESKACKITVLVPKKSKINLKLKNIKVKKIGLLSGHLWEQLSLPIHVRGGFLINFCNTGPIFKRKQLVVIHDTAVHSHPEGFSKKFILWYKILLFFTTKLSEKIVTVSEFSKSEIQKYCKVNKKNIDVIYEGAEHISEINEDNGILRKFNITSKKYVLGVMSFNPNKNFKNLLLASRYLNERDFELVIVGGGNNKVFSQQNISEELKENVKFLGYVTDAELKSLYMNAGCFVFPSIYEGFGIPPLEAMVCGCPVVCSTAASIPEICSEAAVYFDPLEPTEIAEKIKLVMADETLRNRLSKHGIEHSQNYKWSITAKKLLGNFNGDV